MVLGPPAAIEAIQVSRVVRQAPEEVSGANTKRGGVAGQIVLLSHRHDGSGEATSRRKQISRVTKGLTALRNTPSKRDGNGAARLSVMCGQKTRGTSGFQKFERWVPLKG